MFGFNNCRYKNKDLLAGDILFFEQKTMINLFDNFISAISSSYSNNIFHVAIISNVSADNINVIEAKPHKGVINNSYNNICYAESFLASLKISRVNIEPSISAQAAKIAESKIGLAYNDIFSADFHNSNGELSFYCSQLIQYAYNEAYKNEIFPSRPMSFAGDDNNTLHFWIKYYDALGINQVPEGENGTHPGGLYDSDWLSSVDFSL